MKAPDCSLAPHFAGKGQKGILLVSDSSYMDCFNCSKIFITAIRLQCTFSGLSSSDHSSRKPILINCINDRD